MLYSLLRPEKIIKLLCAGIIPAQSQCGALSCHECASDIKWDGTIINLKENLRSLLSFSNRTHYSTSSLLTERNAFCFSSRAVLMTWGVPLGKCSNFITFHFSSDDLEWSLLLSLACTNFGLLWNLFDWTISSFPNPNANRISWRTLLSSSPKCGTFGEHSGCAILRSFS